MISLKYFKLIIFKTSPVKAAVVKAASISGTHLVPTPYTPPYIDISRLLCTLWTVTGSTGSQRQSGKAASPVSLQFTCWLAVLIFVQKIIIKIVKLSFEPESTICPPVECCIQYVYSIFYQISEVYSIWSLEEYCSIHTHSIASH